MVRYPHTLIVTYKGETTFVDGMPVAGSDVEKTITGRAEANGQGNMVRTEDGAQIVYNWSFYSLPTDEVPYGATAELKEGTDTLWTGTVKRHAPGQKTSQIWL